MGESCAAETQMKITRSFSSSIGSGHDKMVPIFPDPGPHFTGNMHMGTQGPHFTG